MSGCACVCVCVKVKRIEVKGAHVPMSTQPTSYSICGLEQLLWQRDCGVTSLSLMSMTLNKTA